jgi:hypothetical protein
MEGLKWVAAGAGGAALAEWYGGKERGTEAKPCERVALTASRPISLTGDPTPWASRVDRCESMVP